MGRRKTPDEVEWLEAFCPGHSPAEIHAAFRGRFGWDMPDASLSSWMCGRGIRCGSTSALHAWSAEERAYLARIVPGRSHAEIRGLMEERFGYGYPGERIAAAIKRYGLDTGRTGCFAKGHEPANKGLSWSDYGTPEGHARSMATTFKPGQRSHNTREIGSERVGKDGYIWIKVAEKFDPDGYNDWRDLWIPKSRAVWQQEHGPLPDGSMVVFADGDNRNFDPGNLVAMTKAEHAVICHRHIPYSDRETCETAIALARLQSKIYEKRRDRRRCAACGREFEPEQPMQVRCRECIDADAPYKRKPRRKKEK